MKYVRAAVITALALLSASIVFAARNSSVFTLSQPVEIGTTQLQPGEYRVEWEGSGSAVQVKIVQAGKTVATATGKMVDHKERSPYNDVILKPGAGQTKTIDQFDFSNSNQSLVLSEGQTDQKTDQKTEQK